MIIDDLILNKKKTNNVIYKDDISGCDLIVCFAWRYGRIDSYICFVWNFVCSACVLNDQEGSCCVCIWDHLCCGGLEWIIVV